MKIKKLIAFTILINFSITVTFGQSQMQKIGDIPVPYKVTFPFFNSLNEGMTSTRSSQLSMGNNDNNIYQFDGTTWTQHSSLLSSDYQLNYPLKTTDGQFWCIGYTFKNNGSDTVAIFNYANNTWKKSMVLEISDRGVFYNFKKVGNTYYAYTSDKLEETYFYQNNSWVKLNLTTFQNIQDYKFQDSYFTNSSNGKLLLNRIVDNKTFLFTLNSNNWVINDSIPNDKEYLYQFAMYNTDSGYVYAYSIEFNDTTKYKVFNLYNSNLSLRNFKIHKSGKYFINIQSNKKDELYCSLASTALFGLDTNYVFINKNNQNKVIFSAYYDVINIDKIYLLKDGLLGKFFVRDAQGSIFQLYKHKENKIVDNGFNYTINNMTVSFSRKDSACSNFIWDFGNGNTSTINPNPIVTYQTSGTYTPCLKCGNSQPVCITISVPCNGCSGSTGIEEDYFNNFLIYPNPTNSNVNIKYDLLINSKINVEVYDILGKKIKDVINNKIQLVGEYNIEFEILNKGVYFIKANTNNQTVVEKLIVY